VKSHELPDGTAITIWDYYHGALTNACIEKAIDNTGDPSEIRVGTTTIVRQTGHDPGEERAIARLGESPGRSGRRPTAAQDVIRGADIELTATVTGMVTSAVSNSSDRWPARLDTRPDQRAGQR
jgi:hypothetical protein